MSMPKVACAMMQKDENLLLRSWLAYHGYLFGFENLVVLDNGSTLPEVRDTLLEYAQKGVQVFWENASRRAFLDKGDLLGIVLRVLDARREYDFLIPLDCDEFIVLRTEDDFVCARDAILTYLASLIGETRTLRFPWQLANHPLQADIYHHFDFFKVFFAAGTASMMDQGHHFARRDPDPGVRNTKLVHLHFHHKMFDIKRAQAEHSWAGTIETSDLEAHSTYAGPSAHLNRYFLESKEQYYRSFLGKVWFFLPRFRELLRELGSPIDLPAEPVPADLQVRVVQGEDGLVSEANGGVVLLPLHPDIGGGIAAAPVEYLAARFHEAHYLAANPVLVGTSVDPTIYFCDHASGERLPLRPSACP